MPPHVFHACAPVSSLRLRRLGLLDRVGELLGKGPEQLALAIRLLQAARALMGVDGAWTDTGALRERVRLAVEIARLAAELSETESDDQLVDYAARVLTDERLLAFVAFAVETILRREPQTDAPVRALEADHVVQASHQAVAAGLNPAVVVALLPYVLELLRLVRDWSRPRPAVQQGVDPLTTMAARMQAHSPRAG